MNIYKIKIAAFALLLTTGAALAAPVTSNQAQLAARAWVAGGDTMGMPLGTTVKSARLYETNGFAYHAVALDGGVVFTSADTESDPIIAFTSADTYEESPQNPLTMLLARDAKVRALAAQRDAAKASSSALAQPAQISSSAARWADLIAAGEALDNITADPSSGKVSSASPQTAISDVRVAPLLETEWNQLRVGGKDCYNYYTPYARYYYFTSSTTISVGDYFHTYCGCSATALAQVLRRWKYPTASRSSGTYRCKVTDIDYDTSGGYWYSYSYYTNITTMAGTYQWSSMTAKPASASSFGDSNRKAIGKLTHDCAVALMSEFSARGTGASPSQQTTALKQAFGYANAQYYFTWDRYYQSTLGTTEALHRRVLYAPLDAGAPVMLAIYEVENASVEGGHCVVGDGYGYATVSGTKTPFVHLNMGWGGTDDVWYNLPNIDTDGAGYDNGNYNVFAGVIYNIFPTNSGEVVSGRILNSSGAGVSGATVSISRNGSSSVIGTTVTSAKGIYSFIVPSGYKYDISASTASGAEGSLTTDTVQASSSLSIGNSWGNDITLVAQTAKPDLAVSRFFLTSSCVTNPAVSSAETSFEVGQPIFAHIAFANNGGSATSSMFESTCELLDANNDIIDGNYYVRSESVPAGQTVVWSPCDLEYLQDLEAGDYVLRFTLDTDNDINESNESNNSVDCPFSVASPSVTLTGLSISGDSTVGPGSRTSYRCLATMSDGGVRAVTPIWSISSGSAYASVDEDGIVAAGVSTSAHTVSLRASYTLDGITKTAYKTISIGAAISLPIALDNTTLSFTTGGDAPWFGQSAVSYDGTDAARSGPIDDNMTSWMQTEVTGPGTLAFRVRISSETRYDKLSVTRGSVSELVLSGVSNEWIQASIAIPSGTSTVRWTYEKDQSYSSGLDAAFVDQVQWIQTVVPRSLSITGESTVVAGGTLQLSCQATLSNGNVIEVTPAWDIDEGAQYATISESGLLTTGNSTDDRTVTVRACFEQNGVAVSTTKAISISGVLPAPDAPVITRSGAGDVSAAYLAWNAVPYAESYDVYRSTTATRPSAPLAAGLVVTSFEDASAQPGVSYVYWVSAKNAAGERYGNSAAAYRVASISATPDIFSIDYEGGEIALTVKANAPWTVAASDPTWLSANASGEGNGSFTGSVLANESQDARSGAFVLTVAPDTAHPSTCRVYVQQSGAPEMEPGRPDYGFAPIDGGDPDLMMYATDSESGTASRLFELGSSHVVRFGWVNHGDAIDEGAVSHNVSYENTDGVCVFSKSIDAQSGVDVGTVVPAAVNGAELPAGPYVLRVLLNSELFFEEKDSSDNQSEYRFAIRDAVDLSEALDNTELTFSTNGDEWFGTAGLGADGEDCAMTGYLGDGQTNSISATVNGPGTISFAYRVSSEENDRFMLLIDGAVAFSESGRGGWNTKSVHIDGECEHILTWSYGKDATLSAGVDCAFLDQVEWIPDYTLDPPTGLVASDGVNSSAVSLSWNAVTGAVSYKVYRSDIEDGEKTIIAEDVTKTSASDSTARGGVTYWYWVKAIFPRGESELSEPDTGYLNATLQPGVYSVTLPGTAGQANVSLGKVNTSWSCSANVDWISFDVSNGDGDGKIVYRYEANETGDSRTGIITIVAAPGTAHELTRTVQLTQAKRLEQDVVSLNEAADCNLQFVTFGDAEWVGQANVSHDARSALRSGSIAKSASSTLRTTLTQGGRLSFWMGTSSYTNHCELAFSVGTNEILRVSGSGGGTSFADYKKKIVIWHYVSVDIPASGAVLTWTYVKDNYGLDRGEDAGFIDEIVWEPEETMPDIPSSWWAKYPGLLERLSVSDYAVAMKMQSPGSEGSNGKFKADGTPMKVWEDYVAGTDPLDSGSKFTATISFDENGLPVIEWLPAMTEAETALRHYLIYGEEELGGEWEPVPEGEEGYYNFFKVTVEMR